MPSNALAKWNSEREAALDEIENAHQSIGGAGPGRRNATEQVNHAYTMLLSSQFQGFCRDLHSESIEFIADQVTLAPARLMLRGELLSGRKLDRGNPSPDNIGSDFGRFSPLPFWVEVRSLDKRNQSRKDRLAQLNLWRNAIAHQDFDPRMLGATTLRLEQVRRWRRACNQLAACFDEVVRLHLTNLFGHSPW